MDITGDRKRRGAMDMADDSVAGNKLWSISFSNHPVWFAIVCFLDCLDAGGNSHIVEGPEWLGYIEPFLHTGTSRRNMLEIC